ncbi:enoyl-CoA hydratase/isomerase family protein [Microbacterium lacus]|uniref:enoyl-CoA hydratase/isomerase family protein n=1 Tax=Microbacterium lacus TaxID=415217 RepID=UPI00384D18C9
MSHYSSLPDTLRVRIEGPVRVVTITRAEAKNAIDGDLHHGLTDVFRLLREDGDARAVLLNAEGDIFSAGGDYTWFQELQNDRLALERSVEEGWTLLDALIRFPLPLVTAIQGGAVGVAASIGILSDIVVMSEDGFYRDTHVKLGMTAADGGLAWSMSAGLQIAKEYVLLGDRLTAAEAYRLGMVNRVVPRADLERVSRDYAERLAALPSRAVRTTKRGFNMQLERLGGGAFEYALASELVSLMSPEHAQTVSKLADRSISRSPAEGSDPAAEDS